MSRTVSQPVSQPVSQTVSLPVSQTVSQPLSQTVYQPVSQPVYQPVSQPVSRPVSQPTSQAPPEVFLKILVGWASVYSEAVLHVYSPLVYGLETLCRGPHCLLLAFTHTDVTARCDIIVYITRIYAVECSLQEMVRMCVTKWSNTSILWIASYLVFVTRKVSVFKSAKDEGGKMRQVNARKKCALLYVVSPVLRAVEKRPLQLCPVVAIMVTLTCCFQVQICTVVLL